MLNLTGETKRDFYPTPSHLISTMLCGIDFNRVETVLEPSAGKGDIAKRVAEKLKRFRHASITSADVDCIEIDQNMT